MRLIQDGLIASARQFGLDRAVFFQIVQIFQKEQPGGLLGIIHLGAATRLAAQDVSDGIEGLLEHDAMGSCW